jgi:poly(3-hydroxybutyrate) depolymerase
MSFDQTEYFPTGTANTILLDKTGYIYVPDACLTQRCKLHVALHGCLQGAYKIGTVYVTNAGYNRVADLNNFIILYPQATNSLISNPNGCFDWWGFTNSNYGTKISTKDEHV